MYMYPWCNLLGVDALARCLKLLQSLWGRCKTGEAYLFDDKLQSTEYGAESRFCCWIAGQRLAYHDLFLQITLISFIILAYKIVYIICMYVHIYIYIYIHTYIHTYTHVSYYIYVYIPMTLSSQPWRSTGIDKNKHRRSKNRSL